MNVECEMIYLNPSKGLRFINKKIITKIPATPFWFYSNLQSRSGGLPRHRVILEQPRLYGLAGIGVSSVGNFGVGYGSPSGSMSLRSFGRAAFTCATHPIPSQFFFFLLFLLFNFNFLTLF